MNGGASSAIDMAGRWWFLTRAEGCAKVETTLLQMRCTCAGPLASLAQEQAVVGTTFLAWSRGALPPQLPVPVGAPTGMKMAPSGPGPKETF